MSIFIQKNNSMTGSVDWVLENENYDHHQEIARSSFADMLHDTERNKLYEAALIKAIKRTHENGRKANVLDIGTGTGLLSMMAIRNGADTVTACEAFKPMSKCALKIIERNGFKDKIKVIPKRSTELIIGQDLPMKCNILVTEVFDTELIGEGALSTFKHAHECLLEKDCFVIPNSATIYAQIIESPLVTKWNKPTFKDLNIPDKIINCDGCAAVHDVQLNQLPLDSFKSLVEPVAVFQFDFSGKTPFVYERSSIFSLKSSKGEAQAVFMWWDLKMDIDNEIILSCAPYWAHPLKKIDELPWRDHWMQAIYYFPKPMKFSENEEVVLIACHDEYSMWFNVRKNLKIESKNYCNPVCTCGFHLFSRTRIGQINDENQNKILRNIVRNKIDDKTVLIFSNGFFLSLLSEFKAKKVYIFENNSFSKKVMLDFLHCNNIENVEIYEEIKELFENIPKKSVDLTLAEPYFITSILPWDNLFFYYTLRKINDLLKENVEIYPKSALIKAVAVKFDNLHKIRTPLKNCEGFDMSDFDKLIQESSEISDDLVETQPLWEYPGKALSSIVEILRIDFPAKTQFFKKTGTMKIESKELCNGIAIWIDWKHGENDDDVILTGPIFPTKIDEKISWNMNSRQGVCLFEDTKFETIHYNFEINLENGTVNFGYN